MAIFANILTLDTCLMILDRLILLKEAALIDIVKNVFRKMKRPLLAKGSNPYQAKKKNNTAVGADQSA